MHKLRCIFVELYKLVVTMVHHQEMQSYFERLVERVNKWLVTSEDKTMVQVVSALLKERNKKLVTAESCTGGYIAHLITGEPGSSQIFNGSVVSYANSVKTDILHVDEQTLKMHGAVSEETVIIEVVRKPSLKYLPCIRVRQFRCFR